MARKITEIILSYKAIVVGSNYAFVKHPIHKFKMPIALA